jgi:hypothetical protein
MATTHSGLIWHAVQHSTSVVIVAMCSCTTASTKSTEQGTRGEGRVSVITDGGGGFNPHTGTSTR